MADDQENIDLNDAWKKQWDAARKAFNITNDQGHLSDSELACKPEEIAAKIRARRNGSKHPEKWDNISDLLLKAGKALVKVTKIAVSVSSQVVGSAQLGVYAIDFFVNAAVKYKATSDDLNDLFSKIGAALERFGVYLENQNELPYKIKLRANLILLQLVKICQIGHNILDGGILTKTKRFVQGALLDKDGGVREALKALNDLTEQETRLNVVEAMVQSIIVRNISEQTKADAKEIKADVKDIKPKIDQIARNQTDERESRESDKQMNYLKEILGEDTQEEARKRLTADAIENSGLWVQKTETYQDWVNSSRLDEPFLLLLGTESSGKSTLSAKIVDFIQARSLDANNSAFVAFAQLTSHGSLGASISNLKQALQAMALQLAKVDMVYRKRLHANLSKLVKTASGLPNAVNMLFELLFVDNSSSATFILVFDDVHELEDIYSFLSLVDFILSKEPKIENLRLLVSSRFEGLKTSAHRLLDQPRIDVELENTDIQKFIELKVNHLRYLSDAAPELRDIRQQIIDTLQHHCRTFNEAQYLLDEISTKQRPPEILEVLENIKSGNAIQDWGRRLLERCSKLRDKDINDLNTLLGWVMSSNDDMSVGALTEILKLRNPKQASFKPLLDRFGDEFQSFFKVSKDMKVSLASDGIRQHFEEATRENLSTLKPSEKHITESEFKLVKKILKNFCDDDIYNKFDFDSFFDQKRRQESSKIYVNTDEMQANVALDSMKFARYSGSDLEKEMASSWLSYLKHADISLLSQHLKVEIGRSIVRMLKDDVAMDQWQPAQSESLFLYSEDETYVCFEKDGYGTMLMKWLEDTAVKRQLPQDQQEWIDNIVSSSITPRYEVWKSVLQYMARYWLLKSDFGPDYNWISLRSSQILISYLDQVRRCQTLEHEPLGKAASSELSRKWTDKEADEVITWAQQAAEAQSLSASMMCRIGDFCQHVDLLQKAAKFYQDAERLDSSLWQAIRGQAMVEYRLGDKSKAITLMESVIQLHKNQEQLDKDHLWNDSSLIAAFYRDTGHFEEALAIYNSKLKEDPLHYPAINAMMDVYKQTDKPQEIREVFKTYASQQFNGHDGLTGMILNVGDDRFYDEDLQELVALAKEVDCLELIQDRFLAAVALAKKNYDNTRDSVKEHEKALITLLRLYRFAVRWYSYHASNAKEMEGLARSLEHALEYIALEDWVRGYLVKDICVYRLAQARNMASGSEKEDKIIKKLKNLQGIGRWEAGVSRAYPLSVYFADRGRLSEAREILRWNMQAGLDLLSDNDPDNDWQGYLNFAESFMRCNDEENALVAFSLIKPDTINDDQPQDKSNVPDDKNIPASSPEDQPNKAQSEPKDFQNENKQTEGETKEAEFKSEDTPSKDEDTKSGSKQSLRGPMEIYCWICWDQSWTYPSDLYWCKFCPRATFCPPCLTKLREGKSSAIHCNADHQWFYVPPWDAEKAARIEPGMVEVGGKIMSIDDWKNEIRTTWNLK